MLQNILQVDATDKYTWIKLDKYFSTLYDALANIFMLFDSFGWISPIVVCITS